MRNKLLLSTAALVTCVTLASAQNMPGGQSGGGGAERGSRTRAAIAKARGWVDDLLGNRVASFAEIAAREGKTERYIRLLASLACISPRSIAAIIDGTAPADLTVAGMAKALPDSWAEQERQFGLRD